MGIKCESSALAVIGHRTPFLHPVVLVLPGMKVNPNRGLVQVRGSFEQAPVAITQGLEHERQFVLKDCNAKTC